MIFEIQIPWPPTTGNHSTRKGAAGFYTQESVKKWRGVVAVAAAQAGLQQELPGPIELKIWASPPDRRAVDDDNVRKVVGDALVKARVLSDDSNKVIKRAIFEWFDPHPGGALFVTITTLDASLK